MMKGIDIDLGKIFMAMAMSWKYSLRQINALWKLK